MNANPAPVCTCFRLRRLARRVTRRYDQALAPSGLNANQYALLRRADGTPRPIGVLAQTLGMDRSTLSRDLKPLQAAGYVKLVAGEDARQRCVRVSAAGRLAVERARPLWRQAQDAMADALGERGLASLHRQLDRAFDALA